MNILVIEPRMSAAESMRAALEGEGHEVTVARTAAQGLRLVRERSFDGVIAAAVQADMSGAMIAHLFAKTQATAELPVSVVDSLETWQEILDALRRPSAE